ncbi:MAG: hypothetical protein ACTH3D_10175 [Halomonas sp.]|uniref:hypothetical protein n=1 Tax=Halomonas sp. TaxID=1486246 RepID=UPI003F92B809
MAERIETSPQAQPIVPDPQASLSQRPYRVRRPRLWPLWFLCLLLLAALSSLAAYGWWYSQQLELRLEDMQGELSNLAARQAGESESTRQHDDEVSRLAARFDRFESEQGRYAEDVEARLASVNRILDSIETRIQQQIGNTEYEESMSESLGIRITAMQSSLKALEQTGKESREALSADLDTLRQQQQTRQQQLAELGDRLETLAGRASQQQQQQQELQDKAVERISTIEQQLADGVTRQQKQMEEAARRIDTIEAQLSERLVGSEEAIKQLDQLARQVREVRQAQLVINAQLEGMAQ